MPATIETQAQADEKMVDLPSDGDSVDVKLDDAEKKINKEDDIEVVNESKEVVIEDKAETASEGEMDDYGKKVQSRIDKLTKKLRESERREQAAIEFAQGVQQKTKDLQTRAKTLDSGYITEFASRVEAETAEAKKIDRSQGDSTMMVVAQQMQDLIDNCLVFHAAYLNTSEVGSSFVNRDFLSTRLEPQEIQALLQLYTSGTIQQKTLLDQLTQGEVLGDEFDVEEEVEATQMGGLIETDPPEPETEEEEPEEVEQEEE